jgi:23S rRNA pseudouridine1911/1915/1917 synthase
VVDVPAPAGAELVAEAFPLHIVFEDEYLLVLNKPPGLTVHPGAGRVSGTLANALVAHLPAVRGVGPPLRPGIVHRLDRDTSGLLVVAKTPAALRALQQAVASHTVERRYLALVHGAVRPDEGTIDAPIGRHPRRRTKMAVVAGARHAVTHYRVVERFAWGTLVDARLLTGRTHQIRVHFASQGHPVVGDAVYGGRRLRGGPDASRQLLHAYRLAFEHPFTGAKLEFDAPLPDDFAAVLTWMRAEGSSSTARKPRSRR